MATPTPSAQQTTTSGWAALLENAKFKQPEDHLAFQAFEQLGVTPEEFAASPANWSAAFASVGIPEGAPRMRIEAQLRKISAPPPGSLGSGAGPSSLPGTAPELRRYPVGFSNPSESQFFVVNRVGENIKALHKQLIDGGCYLFHGPRQTGKTTTFRQSLPLLTLQGLTVVFISMEALTRTVHHTFFGFLNHYLATYYPQLPQMSTPNKDGFLGFINVNNFPSPLVLLVDEFDVALTLQDKQDLLEGLRFTQNESTGRLALRAFAGIGTYGMMEAVAPNTHHTSTAHDCVSPFNLASFCAVPNFSRAEHQQLHIEQAGLPQFLEEDIWALSNGKPGASVWLGDFALDFYRHTSNLNLAAWANAKKTLVSGFSGTATMRAMLSHLDKPGDKELLYTLMRTNTPRILMPHEVTIGEHLAECGAAVMDSRHQSIMPAAPIIQQVILYYTDVVTRPLLRAAEVPHHPQYHSMLDIPSILQLVIAEFNWRAIADEHCAKQCRVAPFRITNDTRKIADEQVFQTELLIGLRELLCLRTAMPTMLCLPETKNTETELAQLEYTKRTQVRLDILLYNGGTYVLELCANIPPSNKANGMEKDSIASHVYKAANR